MLYSSVSDEVSKIVVLGEFLNKKRLYSYTYSFSDCITCPAGIIHVFTNLLVLDTEYSPFNISVSPLRSSPSRGQKGCFTFSSRAFIAIVRSLEERLSFTPT